MYVNQAIENPFGITVFGSAIIRVQPDIASLSFAVTRLRQHPNEAFEEAHESAKKVREYLAGVENCEVASSRATMHSVYHHHSGERVFDGYEAQIGYHVLLRNLDQIEEVYSGIVDAGVNELWSMEMQTSRLKELRAEARRRAVAAAREKAELYCEAAGAVLGEVLHIEDVNPDNLRGREGHSTREFSADDSGGLKAVDPGSIVVAGAVMSAYAINPK